MDSYTKTSQEAWDLRENGDITPAIAIWMGLYYQFVKEGNWDRAISTLIDIAISWKILGEVAGNKTYFATALETLHFIQWSSEKENVPLRNDFNYHLAGVQTANGMYEEAIASYERYLSTHKTPYEEANIKAHVGFARANAGSRDGGIQDLRDSLRMFEEAEKNPDIPKKDIFHIWRLGAKLRLAQVVNDKEEKKKLLQEVLAEAQEKGFKARESQAEALLKTK